MLGKNIVDEKVQEISSADKAEIRDLVASWMRGSAKRGSAYRRKGSHEGGAIRLRAGDPALTGDARDQSKGLRSKALWLIAKDVDVWIFTLMIVALGVIGRPLRG